MQTQKQEPSLIKGSIAQAYKVARSADGGTWLVTFAAALTNEDDARTVLLAIEQFTLDKFGKPDTAKTTLNKDFLPASMETSGNA